MGRVESWQLRKCKFYLLLSFCDEEEGVKKRER